MLNSWSFVGRAVTDPDIKYGESNGKPYCVAFVRVAADVFSGGERKAVFIDVKAWAKTGEILAEKIRKGQLFGGVGQLETESWETADGEKRSKVTCTLQQLQLLERFDASQQQEQPEYETAVV